MDPFKGGDCCDDCKSFEEPASVCCPTYNNAGAVASEFD